MSTSKHCLLQQRLIEFYNRQKADRAGLVPFSAVRAIQWGERIDFSNNNGPEGNLCAAIDKSRAMDPEDRLVESALRCLSSEHRDAVFFLCAYPHETKQDQFNFSWAALNWCNTKGVRTDPDKIMKRLRRVWENHARPVLARLLEMPEVLEGKKKERRKKQGGLTKKR